MIIIILASLIIFCSLLSMKLKQSKKENKETEQSFWNREHKANSVRRKPLDHLEYITIPMDQFPTQLLREDSMINECIETLEVLSCQPIVNLTGYTNTDLKLEYGTANITVLMEYDQNYTTLVRTLQKWADLLLEKGFTSEAETLMKFAVSTGTDISRTYYKLAENYAIRLETERIKELIDVAETLRSSNKKIIVRTLQESYL